MESCEAAEACAAYIKKQNPEAFVMISFAATPEGYTRGGFLAKKLFWKMQQSEAVDAVGFNCVSGPKHLLELVRKFPKERIEKYLTVMPNAGYPTMVGNRIHYGTNRKYFGQVAYDLLQEGVSIVGGCCGTTPEDIAQIQSKMQDYCAEKKQRLLGGEFGSSEKNTGAVHNWGYGTGGEASQGGQRMKCLLMRWKMKKILLRKNCRREKRFLLLN